MYLDVANRDARFIRSDEDSGRHFDFVVLTDSNTLARIMSGQTGMSEAVRDGCFSIHPADSIPVSDYQQLFLELTSIVTGGDKVRKYEPMSAMMIANTPEKTDRLHS